MVTDYNNTEPPPLVPKEEEESDDEERMLGGEGGRKMPPLTPDPLVEMRLTDNIFPGWRWASLDFKKKQVITRAPTDAIKVFTSWPRL